jgi:hypothetical protein
MNKGRGLVVSSRHGADNCASSRYEFATCVSERLPMKELIVNASALQELPITLDLGVLCYSASIQRCSAVKQVRRYGSGSASQQRR